MAMSLLGAASLGIRRRLAAVPLPAVVGSIPPLRRDAGLGAACWRPGAVLATGPFSGASSNQTMLAFTQVRQLAAEATEKKKKTTTPKRTPDPDRPKRPASAWILFLSDFRKKEAQQPEGIRKKGAEVMRGAAAAWSTMDDASKAPYVQPYQAAKKAYDSQYQEYVNSGKKDAWKRDPERPKKPLTGYMRYLQQFRANNKGLVLTEAARHGAAAWKALSEQQKAPYLKAYTEDKQKYDTKMEAYKASGKAEAWKARVGLAAAPEKAKGATKSA